jgi:hypothetical protein
MSTLHKKVEFPKIACTGTRRINLPDVEIELRYEDKGPELSIIGRIWNSKHTDIIRGGQCLDYMIKYPELSRNPLFRKLYRWWKLYHLNGMHAGTVNQDKALKDSGKIFRSFSEQCDYLKSINLYEDNGYRYGSAWLYREIPEKDLNDIESFLLDENSETM